ncbi:MAG TPA: hypothetical protein VFE34_25660 [Dongiaceae bacterium]|jgi:hypothetical protein|nr:hypothetical protein [Dongiaceae bacterium]
MQNAAQALARVRAEWGLDPTYDMTATWPFTIGPMTVPMPNFSWRRAAIQRHEKFGTGRARQARLVDIAAFGLLILQSAAIILAPVAAVLIATLA